MIDISHVLLTGKDSVRLSACGLLDVTRPDTSRQMGAQQHEDLLSIGRLLVCLACTSPSAASSSTLQKSMGYIQASFSPELNQLLMLLLGGGSAPRGGPARSALRMRSGTGGIWCFFYSGPRKKGGLSRCARG